MSLVCLNNLASCTPTSEDLRVFAHLQLGLEQVRLSEYTFGMACCATGTVAFSKSSLYQTSSLFAKHLANCVTFNSAAISNLRYNPV